MPITAPMKGMKSGAEARTPCRRSATTCPISWAKIKPTRPTPNHQPPEQRVGADRDDHRAGDGDDLELVEDGAELEQEGARGGQRPPDAPAECAQPAGLRRLERRLGNEEPIARLGQSRSLGLRRGEREVVHASDGTRRFLPGAAGQSRAAQRKMLFRRFAPRLIPIPISIARAKPLPP